MGVGAGYLKIQIILYLQINGYKMIYVSDFIFADGCFQHEFANQFLRMYGNKMLYLWSLFLRTALFNKNSKDKYGEVTNVWMERLLKCYKMGEMGNNMELSV